MVSVDLVFKLKQTGNQETHLCCCEKWRIREILQLSHVAHVGLPHHLEDGHQRQVDLQNCASYLWRLNVVISIDTCNSIGLISLAK